MDIVLTICVAAIFCCLWALTCNEKTCAQRHRLIDAWSGRDDWRQLADDYDAVTYNRHLLTLMLFQEPERLYSERLIAALRGLP